MQKDYVPVATASQPPCSVRQEPSSADDLHRAALFVVQSQLCLCRAQRSARNGRVRRILAVLIDAQEVAVSSLERLRSGALGAL